MALLALLLALAAPAAEPREPIESCTMAVIWFAPGSAKVDPARAHRLDEFARWRPNLEKMPSTRFVIIGSTDSTGPAAANLILSRRRAEAVREYVVARGFPARLLSIQADGERADPPDPRERDTGRSLARSVVIMQETARSEWRSVHGTVVC